ncbi:MAG: isoaspartyl peptidase/L-asparaginase [Thermoplasmatota archaeon]
MTLRVLAHGGAGSYDHKEHDGPQTAADVGLQALQATGSVLDAVIAATVHLEDDPRFNAGTGSNVRLDGTTIEMDASVTTCDGRFGAVACIENVQNPVLVAKDVLETPHNLLAGKGATAYARTRGHAPYDPTAPVALEKFAKLQAMLAAGAVEDGWCEWDLPELEKHWNFSTPFREAVGCSDTVGAVASNGTHFAAALSTGGTISTLLGRVGDVPMIGCGLWAGPAGAVCVTGDGDHLARAKLASRVQTWLEEGKTPDECVGLAIQLFPPEVAVGLLVVNPHGGAGGSNLQMAWGLAEAS